MQPGRNAMQARSSGRRVSTRSRRPWPPLAHGQNASRGAQRGINMCACRCLRPRQAARLSALPLPTLPRHHWWRTACAHRTPRCGAQHAARSRLVRCRHRFGTLESMNCGKCFGVLTTALRAPRSRPHMPRALRQCCRCRPGSSACCFASGQCGCGGVVEDAVVVRQYDACARVRQQCSCAAFCASRTYPCCGHYVRAETFRLVF